MEIQRIGIPVHLAILIGEYAARYTFAAWVNIDSISNHMICMHPEVVDMIESGLEIDWEYLSFNSVFADKLLEDIVNKNNKSNWGNIQMNRSEKIVKFLKQHPERLYRSIWANPMMIEWLLSDDPALDRLSSSVRPIYWHWLSANPHPLAIALLEKNLDKVDWSQLHTNPGAWHLLKYHWSGAICNYKMLSQNTHPEAVRLLREFKGSFKYPLGSVKWSLNPSIFEAVIPSGLMGELLRI